MITFALLDYLAKLQNKILCSGTNSQEFVPKSRVQTLHKVSKVKKVLHGMPVIHCISPFFLINNY